MSDPCGCIYVSDYDPPELYDPRIRVARKGHWCGECHSPILPGESYEYVFGKWEGRIDTCKTCLTCLSIREAFFCDGFMHGSVMENVREHIYGLDGRIGFDCLEKLNDQARTRILKIMEEVMRDLDE